MVKISHDFKIKLFTALLTLVLTNPLSIIITNKINGPAPGIIINSINFSKDTDKRIVLDDELLSEINDLLPTDKINKYVNFFILYDLYTNINYNKNNLELSIEQAQLWLSSLKNDKLSTQEIENSPFINFKTMRDITLLILFDDKIPKTIPISSDEVSKNKENLIPFFVQNGNIGFRLKSYDILLTNMRRATKDQNENIENLLLSYVYGNKENIKYFTNLFLSNSSKYILKYNKISEIIKNILVEKTELEAIITLYNNGRSPIIFTPDFSLRINHMKYDQNKIKMTVIKDDMNPQTLLNNLKRMLNEYLQQASESLNLNDGETLKLVDSISPSSFELFQDNPSSYQISVQPGNTRTIVLRGTNNLINKNDLFKSFQSELLNCTITGTTTNGKKYKSNEALFGTLTDKNI